MPRTVNNLSFSFCFGPRGLSTYKSRSKRWIVLRVSFCCFCMFILLSIFLLNHSFFFCLFHLLVRKSTQSKCIRVTCSASESLLRRRYLKRFLAVGPLKHQHQCVCKGLLYRVSNKLSVAETPSRASMLFCKHFDPNKSTMDAFVPFHNLIHPSS